jgi:hypothetical protein
MRTEVTRNLLKYAAGRKNAAGRKMFCDCGKFMDWRDTIILKGLITCCDCFEKQANDLLRAADDQGRANFRDWLGKVDFLSAYSWSFDDAGLLVKGSRTL